VLTEKKTLLTFNNNNNNNNNKRFNIMKKKKCGKMKGNGSNEKSGKMKIVGA
jgi:hypothetical protein